MGEKKQSRIFKVRDFIGEFHDDQTRLLPRSVVETCIVGAEVREDAIDPDKREVTAIITDPSIDSYGESIAAGAFDASLSRFMRNPAFLPAHMHRLQNGHPATCGKVVEITHVGEALAARFRFGATEVAEQWWRAYRNGDLRAFSVGFRPVKAENVSGVYTYLEAELKEVSAVAVPANSNALVIDFIKSQIGKIARGASAVPESVCERIDVIESRIDALYERQRGHQSMNSDLSARIDALARR